MGMRETVGSMRAYFIVVGLVAAGIGALTLYRLGLAPTGFFPGWLVIVLYALPIVTLLVSLALLYAGFTVKSQFEKGEPRRIQKIILLSGGAYLLSGAVRVGLIMAFVPGNRGLTNELIEVGIGFAITWYLYVNARRLANEAIEKRKQEASEAFE